MATIIMKDWREGMQKVSLTKLQCDLLKLSLKSSKDNVDRLLEGEPIKIEIEDNSLIDEFVKRADAIGVNCYIV